MVFHKQIVSTILTHQTTKRNTKNGSSHIAEVVQTKTKLNQTNEIKLNQIERNQTKTNQRTNVN